MSAVATVRDLIAATPGVFLIGFVAGWVFASFFRIERVRRNGTDKERK